MISLKLSLSDYEYFELMDLLRNCADTDNPIVDTDIAETILKRIEDE